jgi:hypothetical protein
VLKDRRLTQAALAIMVAASTWFAPAPAAAQRDRSIPTGAVLELRMNTKLSSKTSRAGDRFTATVIRPLDVDGDRIVPEGATVEGRVTSVEAAKRLSRSGTIAVEFDRLVLPDGRSVPILGQLTSLDPEERRKIDEEGAVRGSSTTKRSVIFIGGGAGVGAIIGAVSGSAGTGTGIGAGLGTAAVLLSKGNEAEIDAGFEFGLEVLRPVVIPEEEISAEPEAPETFESETDILYVQNYMRDRGLYTGPIDGRLSPATRSSVVRLQRALRLEESGAVDQPTGQAIGLLDDLNAPMQPVKALAVDTQRNPNGVEVYLTAQTTTGGWGVYENHFVTRNTLHVYLRGVAPNGPATQALTRHELQFALSPAEARGVTQFVVHGADGDLSGAIGESVGGGLGVDLRGLEQRLLAMRASYERALGVRAQPRTGDLTFTGRGYNEGELELYYALGSLADSTRLLAQMSAGVRDPQALQGATGILVRTARMFDRAVERGKSQRTAQVAREWQQLRPEFVRLAELAGRQFERDAE